MISLQAFREWAVLHGSVSNPTTNPNNFYTGECVSLIQQYLAQVFGIPYNARGHAKDFVPPTFTRVTDGSRRPGDIIRYGRPYGVVNGVFYGHIGMIDDEGKYLDQNGVVARRVGRREAPFNYIESVWRPTTPFTKDRPAPGPAPVPGPKPAPNTGLIRAKGTATVIVNELNIRNAPTTGSGSIGTYKKGQKFNYDYYQIANGYLWLSYISMSGVRRYVAEGPNDGREDTVFVTGGV